MNLEVITPTGTKIIYSTNPEVDHKGLNRSAGDLLREEKEYRKLPGYSARFK